MRSMSLGLAWLAMSAGSVAAQAPSVQMLHRFAIGTTPQSPVTVTSVPEGGALVVTRSSSTVPSMMITRVLPDGSIRTLHVMPYDGSRYSSVVTPLVRGGDGRYYGIVEDGSVRRSLFHIDLDGHFTIVYTFQGLDDGAYPFALFPGPGGTIYGVARAAPGGLPYRVFVIGADGTLTLGAFAMSARPTSVGTDGAVYGLSAPGPCGNFSVVVRRDPSGAEMPIAAPLPSDWCGGFTDAVPVSGGVVAIAERQTEAYAHRCGLWYIASGTARIALELPDPCGSWSPTGGRRLRDDGAGGAIGVTERYVFRVTAAGVATVLTQLSETGGLLASPLTDLDRRADGTLWAVGPNGSTFNGGGVMAVPAAGRPTLVAAFAGGNYEGRDPQGPVVADADGFLYGTTAEGGDYGAGVLYRVSRTDSRFDVLYTFTGRGDGRSPTGLVQTADGAMYGTTTSGDGHDGTVFRIGRSGALTTLFVFRRDQDGVNPGALVVGSDGRLYGRTLYGGMNGWGTAFRISPTGEMVVLYHFPAGSEAFPATRRSNSPFTLGRDGQFYATTAACNSIGCFGGSVFRMSPIGQVAVLWATSGSELMPQLFQAADLRLWGSLSHAGAFVIPPLGTATLVPIPLDGRFALQSQTSDGNFVGLADQFVSTSYRKALFQLTPQGRVREFATLPRLVDLVRATLVDGRDGFLYGTAPTDYPVTDLGAVFRVETPGPSAPTGIRIVR